jgi:16S rRNA C967 or C1407 C5-methylase (RsmB/RsmF family)/NOL1/NOP2/fmu family ribosome biogenesis protein
LNLPEYIVNDLKNYHIDTDALAASHLTKGLTSIRYNTHKIPKPTIEQAIPWCKQGSYMAERPFFAHDPLWHAGAYYVQEASSMLVGWALQHINAHNKPLVVLDACAAPGGKSTHLLSVISADSLLVSNEVIKARVSILLENTSKWGHHNHIITNNDTSNFTKMDNAFDALVIDAPCSGSGLFRKDVAAMDEWSVDNVNLCNQRQQRILHDLVPSLKPNGILIYSTCSYSTAENETIADEIISMGFTSIALPIESSWGITATQSSKHNAHGYRCMPYLTMGEGFYIACFIKNGDDNYSENNYNKRSNNDVFKTLDKKTNALLNNFVDDVSDVFLYNDSLHQYPIKHLPMLQKIAKHLYIKKAGLCLGQIVGTDVLPHHDWAMSIRAPNKYASVAIDTETALTYLRKNLFTLTNAPKGWILLTYNGIGLGWVKNLGNRLNNYYPTNYRLLK